MTIIIIIRVVYAVEASVLSVIQRRSNPVPLGKLCAIRRGILVLVGVILRALL